MHLNKNSKTIPLIVANASLMGFAIWLPAYCVPPMEHIIKEEFFLTHTQASLLFTGPFLTLVAVGFIGGFIADRIGAKRAIGIGAIIMTTGALLRGSSTNFLSLLIFTLIYGVGLGLAFPNLPKIISSWVPARKIGMALGIYSAAMFAGEALAIGITIPFIFPVADSFNGVFFVWSAPLVAATISWWVLIKEPSDPIVIKESVKPVGSALREVLRNQNLWLLAILYLITCFFYNIWVGWSPALLMLKGATPDLAGIITSITIWIGIPAALLIPMISDRFRRRKPFLWAGMITLAICAWVAIDVNLLFSWPLMAMTGIALTSIIPIIFTATVEMMPGDSAGAASGLVISIGMIGSAIGPLVGGRILDLTENLNLALLVLIAFSVLGTTLAFRLPETRPKMETNK